jgi:hypothetical protein
MNDPFRYENITGADRARALDMAKRMSMDGVTLDPRLLERVLSSPEEFNSKPLEMREAFFANLGSQPIKVSQNAPASGGTSGGAPSGLLDALQQTRREYEARETTPEAPATSGLPADLRSALDETRKEYETQKATQEAQTKATNLGSVPTVTQNLAPAAQPPATDRKVGRVMEEPSKLTQFGRSAASLFDVTVGGIAPSVIEPVTYAGARAFGKGPEEAKKISTAAAEPFESPLGKTLGITETPEYKGEATRRLFDFVGENFQKGAAWIAEKTGLPVNDVENMMGTVAAGAGLKAAPVVQRGTLKGAEAVETALGTAPTAPPVAGALPRIEPQMAPAQPKPRISYADLQAQLEARKTAGATPDLQADFDAKKAMPSMAQTGANPFAGKFTGEETVRGEFPQIKLQKMANDVPTGEKELRAAVVSEVLGGAENIRPGVVTGNEQTLRNEYVIAKKAGDTPEGIFMRELLANEQNALSRYASERVDNSGANPTFVSPAERGQVINDFFAGRSESGQPPTSLTGFFSAEKQRLYDEARQKVGANPITTSNVDNLLADPQFRAGLKLTKNQDVAGGAEELINLARTTGFRDQFGVMHGPNTIGAWDAVRKSLNANWTKDNASTIKTINQAIDKDIASAGGGDMIKRADQLHQMEKTIFDSKGIKTIFGEIDSNGVETGIDFEKIPKKVNELSFSQWKHIYDTADKLSQGVLTGPIDPKTKKPKWELVVPDEVRAAAESAKNEMRGNIAREIYQAGAAKAGAWNSNTANNVLNARSDKIRYSFPLDEQQAFHKLNYAGYMMPEQHPYEGGGLQQRRVGFVEKLTPAAAVVTGTAIGSAIDLGSGSAVGAMLGQQAGEKLKARKTRKEDEKQAKKTETKTKAFGEWGKEVKLKDIGKD